MWTSLAGIVRIIVSNYKQSKKLKIIIKLIILRVLLQGLKIAARQMWLHNSLRSPRPVNEFRTISASIEVLKLFIATLFKVNWNYINYHFHITQYQQIKMLSAGALVVQFLICLHLKPNILYFIFVFSSLSLLLFSLLRVCLMNIFFTKFIITQYWGGCIMLPTNRTKGVFLFNNSVFCKSLRLFFI